jgi:hypothetical protein
MVIADVDEAEQDARPRLIVELSRSPSGAAREKRSSA